MREHKYGQTFGGSGGDGVEPPKKTHTPETVPGSPLSQVVDAIRNTGHGFIFQAVHAFGRTTTERRVSRRVQKVKWALGGAGDGYLTPAQEQALAMLYGCVMPPAECARRLGIERQRFQARLRRGEAIVDRLWDGTAGRNRWKKGRPNAVINAPEGAEWMYLRARESLGVGAGYIWGSDWHLNPHRLSDEEFEAMLAAEGLTVEDLRGE